MHTPGEAGKCGRNAARPTDEVARGDAEPVARSEMQRAGTFQHAGPNLRTAQILQDGHLAVRALRRAADPGEGRSVRLLCAVREVEAEDVSAGGDQRVEHRVGIAGGTDRRNDLRVPHVQSAFIMGQIVPDPIERYLADLNHLVDPVLEDIARAGAAEELPLIDSEVGALLRVLATAIGAQRILEIGTAIGYSGIWLAGGLAPGGQLITLEMNPDRAKTARDNFRRAGFDNRANVIVGDAAKTLAKVAGPFDLIFQDGDKRLYMALLDRLVGLLRPGGLLVTDNVLWDGEVAPGFTSGPKRDAEITRAIAEYNERINSHPQLMTVTVPLRDGVAIAVKRTRA